MARSIVEDDEPAIGFQDACHLVEDVDHQLEAHLWRPNEIIATSNLVLEARIFVVALNQVYVCEPHLLHFSLCHDDHVIRKIDACDSVVLTRYSIRNFIDLNSILHQWCSLFAKTGLHTFSTKKVEFLGT